VLIVLARHRAILPSKEGVHETRDGSVHHTEDWARGGHTNIDKLTLACQPDHNLAEQGWRTIKLGNGQTQWIPPPHLDHGQPRTNNYHHPERFFEDENDTG
ncbi:HNH endonuclease, partial [Mycobacterium xenopi]|uniref:HNH endonuclease n=1 Tax=Mycobacterium xenopi TaxID=1789 RepID=UPI001B80D9C6